MRVVRISYECTDSKEIHRWLEHIIEEVILNELEDVKGSELAHFKAVKYVPEQYSMQDRDQEFQGTAT
jgi:hypothetical protein